MPETRIEDVGYLTVHLGDAPPVRVDLWRASNKLAALAREHLDGGGGDRAAYDQAVCDYLGSLGFAGPSVLAAECVTEAVFKAAEAARKKAEGSGWLTPASAASSGSPSGDSPAP